MEVKPGYEQTEVGVIPEDWNAAPLAAVCAMKSGAGITSANIDGFSKFPCYGGNGLRGFTSRFTHKGGYALIGRQGALCGNVLGVEGTFFASEHAIVVTAFPQTDIRWLTYVLGEMHLNQYSESSAQPGLSVAKLLHLDLAVPPTKAEQRAIAGALSDVDALLGALNQLIAKKRGLKQAAMQQLLTGQTRLPGFHGEWRSTTLGQIISRFSTGLNPRQNFRLNAGGSFFYVTIKNFSVGQLFLDEKCDLIDEAAIMRINERSDLKKDDILFSSIGRVGDAYLIRETPRNWNINESVFTLRPDQTQVVPLMLFYLLTNKTVKDALTQGVTGSTFKSIKQAELKAIPCRIPISQSEQTAIAEVLSDMDAELAALEQRRAKTRALKQGMMQELLTGRTRLVEPSPLRFAAPRSGKLIMDSKR